MYYSSHWEISQGVPFLNHAEGREIGSLIYILLCKSYEPFLAWLLWISLASSPTSLNTSGGLWATGVVSSCLALGPG